ncbi:adenyl-nucleotide exchange factor sse1 [Phlyctochytrium planicorne]|nr:adenyl-nucleotide exchange factor sse1 [Phlyctochytrium planicorne]
MAGPERSASKPTNPRREVNIPSSTLLRKATSTLRRSSPSTKTSTGSSSDPTDSELVVFGYKISVSELVVPTIILVACGVLAFLVYQRTRSANDTKKASKKPKKKAHQSLLDDHPNSQPENQGKMSVVGIDFGNLNTVVAVARNRGIDVITNEVSNRATPSLVSFGEKQRYLGESAKTQEISNFKSTVSTLKRLVGRPFEDPDVLAIEQKYVNAKLVKGERGETAAEVLFQGENRVFTFTQLTAMFLAQVKDFTSKEIKMPVSDVVISVPGWFTDRQRRALLNASEIAGLNCLRLMNELTASALGYGITKLDLPDTTVDPKAKPRTVLFFDLGHSSLQVAVVEFVKGKLVVKGTGFDRNLGGRDFDAVLVDFYVKEFDAKYKMNIRSNAKALFRLAQGCEKVKKVLSANAVTQLNIECLLDDKDVSAQVQRSDYMEWVQPLMSRLQAPVDEALAAAGVKPSDVDFVELVGGSTRVPAVKEFLAKYFGGSIDGENKLSTTLNQDEAIARGCALQCAIISPAFKVRDFSVQDWNSYPIFLSWDASLVPPSKSGEPVDAKVEAFNIGNPIPSVKALTFSRILKEEELAKTNGHVTFDVNAYYGAEAASRNIPFVPENTIGTFTVKGIKKLNGDPNAAGEGVAKATIRVKAKLDANNVVIVEGAQQIEEVLVPAEEEKKEEKDAKKDDKKSDKKKDDKKDEKKDDSAMETDDAAASPADATTPVSLTPSSNPVPPKLKRVTRKHDLVIAAHTSAATGDLIKEWHALEGEMSVADRLVIDTAERRNALEEYVYYARGKLEMAWSDFISDADREVFMKELNDMEDWLYGDGEDATKSVYQENLNTLKVKGDPVAERALDWEERPRAEKQFREYVNSVLLNLQAEDGRYDHISKEDLEKVSKQVNAKLAWLTDALGAIHNAPKHVTPKVNAAAINREKELLTHFVNPILNKPKPAPPKETKKEEPAADADGDKKMDEAPAAEEAKKEEANMDVD